MHILVDDNWYGEEYSLAPYFNETTAFIDDARMAGGKVLVHCWAGKSRSSTLITAYLISRAGLTRDAALRHIRQHRPFAKPNPQYMRELEDLEMKLRTFKADESDGPFPESSSFLGPGGKLNDHIEYSTLRRALVEKCSDDKKKWKALFRYTRQLRSDTDPTTSTCRSIANLSYSDLSRALLQKYPASSVKEALRLMRLVEIDGEPVPIDEYDIRFPPRLFLGSAGAGCNAGVLADTGITHIIQIASSNDTKVKYPDKFSYLDVSVGDNEGECELSKYYEQCANYIDTALGDGGKVMVTCSDGMSRSSLVMASYLMKYRDLNRKEALQVVRETRTHSKANKECLVD